MLASTDVRGVDVRGLIWRSHWEKLNFKRLREPPARAPAAVRGAEALLDMRVRTAARTTRRWS